MDTIAASLQAAARRLERHSESPRLDAELLLCKVLGVSRTALIAGGERVVPDERRRAYEALIARRSLGTPVSYLTGNREFWSLDLAVTPDVLVPRPETELLVELALSRCPRAAVRSVLDLGTGSGAIALAIAAERPMARVTAVEVSPAALAIARQNARALESPGIEWRLGSWFEAVPGERFDLIVANPPYVAAGDPALATLHAEPGLALTPGPTGLEALAAIAAGAAAHLTDGGWLILEHGSSQAAQVSAMLARAGFEHIGSHADHGGHPRVTQGAVSFHPSPQEHP